jgi:hypothetical protein
MSNYIFTQSETKTKPTTESKYYTILGDHDFIDDENKPRVNEPDSTSILAKTIAGTNKTKYFVKVGTYGKLFNPMGMFSEGKHNNFLSKIGRKEWEFKEVNAKIFDMYINFLSSKNVAWLNNAQRELT